MHIKNIHSKMLSVLLLIDFKTSFPWLELYITRKSEYDQSKCKSEINRVNWLYFDQRKV